MGVRPDVQIWPRSELKFGWALPTPKYSWVDTRNLRPAGRLNRAVDRVRYLFSYVLGNTDLLLGHSTGT